MSEMKKHTVRTDRFEATLCYLEEGDCTGPTYAPQQTPYLLIGPPGGQPARIEGLDAQLVMMLLVRCQHGHRRYMGPPPLTGCCD